MVSWLVNIPVLVDDSVIDNITLFLILRTDGSNTPKKLLRRKWKMEPAIP